MLQSQDKTTPNNDAPLPWQSFSPTALLVLADGMILEAHGFGAIGETVGELCFNTAMTGYEETLTDPSYAGQILTFTFPHIGNVGANMQDIESLSGGAFARGVIVHAPATDPSNFRAAQHFDAWLKACGIIGLYGIDTRALTSLIREKGMPNAMLVHAPDGHFDRDALRAKAKAWPGILGMDLVPDVTCNKGKQWDETVWSLENGFGKRKNTEFHVVALDYGIKRNILRLLANVGCQVTILPATASVAEIMALNPDGVFLANGPGDPAATGVYAVPTIRALIENKLPIFGICLGHQMLGLAIGAKTVKMAQGHHGVNHPVKEHATSKVEIVSMNHGFAVDRDTLPASARETHVSLFDGSNCGIELVDAPAFSVQHHPEASPGPQDSHYLFDRFVTLMRKSAKRK